MKYRGIFFSVVSACWLVWSLPLLAAAATSTSTTAGGGWHDPITWESGVVPDATDEVLVRGLVQAFEPIIASTIIINDTGELQLTRDTGSITTNQLTNYGVISADPFSGRITMDIIGTLANYGQIAPFFSDVTIRGDVINQGTIDSTLYLAGDDTGSISVTGSLPSLYLAGDIQLTSDLVITGTVNPGEFQIQGNGHTLTIKPNQPQTWWYGLTAPGLQVVAATGTGRLILNGDVLAQSVTIDTPLDVYGNGGADPFITITADQITNNADISGYFSFHQVALRLDGRFSNQGSIGSNISPVLYVDDMDTNGELHGGYHVVGWESDPEATGYQYKLAPTLAQLSSATTADASLPYSDNIFDLLADSDQAYYWRYRTVRERLLFADEYGLWSDVRTINVPLGAVNAAVPADFFQFDAIDDVALGDDLPLIITAADPNFAGVVSLSAAAGDVYPRSFTLRDGVWSGPVEFFAPATNQLLYVSGTGDAAGQRGQSNEFVVSASVIVPGQIRGTVRQSDGSVRTNGLVTVTDDRAVTRAIPLDTSGRYEVTVPSGRYYVSTVESPVVMVEVREEQVVLQDLVEQSACVTDRTPVLLIPGIQGSDSVGHRGWFPELYPHIPRWDSGELEVHDPLSVVGFDTLAGKLVAEEGYTLNCDLFAVPYDWSLSIPDIAAQYLAPWIAHAQQVSGQESVDIVAHSMGGLVARAYIQDLDYVSGTVRKFAMVGTPNQGSTQAYFSWEGGDPIKADEFGGDWLQDAITDFVGADQFQTKTLSRNYSIKTSRPDPCLTPLESGTLIVESGFNFNRYASCDNYALRTFLHNYAPSVGQLYPTYDLLFTIDGFKLESNYENNFLRALNNQQCQKGDCSYNYNLFSDSGVNAKIFVGVEEVLFSSIPQASTPSTITVAPNINPEPYYTDGLVVAVSEGVGDGTVLESSVQAIYNDEVEVGDDDHSSLVRFFMDEISNYISN